MGYKSASEQGKDKYLKFKDSEQSVIDMANTGTVSIATLGTHDKQGCARMGQPESNNVTLS